MLLESQRLGFRPPALQSGVWGQAPSFLGGAGFGSGVG